VTKCSDCPVVSASAHILPHHCPAFTVLTRGKIERISPLGIPQGLHVALQIVAPPCSCPNPGIRRQSQSVISGGFGGTGRNADSPEGDSPASGFGNGKFIYDSAMLLPQSGGLCLPDIAPVLIRQWCSA